MQVSYIFMPVASAITALTDCLLAYLAQAGFRGQAGDALPSLATAGATAQAQSKAGRPGNRSMPGAMEEAASAVLVDAELAPAWEAAASKADAASASADAECNQFAGAPEEYLTPRLPRVMFEHVAALVSMGVKMDAVARAHGIDHLRALDVVKHQVCPALQLLCFV